LKPRALAGCEQSKTDQVDVPAKQTISRTDNAHLAQHVLLLAAICLKDLQSRWSRISSRCFSPGTCDGEDARYAATMVGSRQYQATFAFRY
jgi:hypothetical protein